LGKKALSKDNKVFIVMDILRVVKQVVKVLRNSVKNFFPE